MLPWFTVQHQTADVFRADSFFLQGDFPQDVGLESHAMKVLKFFPSPVVADGKEKKGIQRNIVSVEFGMVYGERDYGEPRRLYADLLQNGPDHDIAFVVGERIGEGNAPFFIRLFFRCQIQIRVGDAHNQVSA